MSNEVQTVSGEATICNRYGLHARPAALIVKTARRYLSEITLEDDFGSFNAKEIMAVLTGEFCHGKKIRIVAAGLDAQAAVTALTDVLSNIPIEA